MRLWSLHPQYLDAKGIVACWREGLLARKVLLNQTNGYRNHPQLERFKNTADPAASMDAYLGAVADEAEKRGYSFDRSKIESQSIAERLQVTSGQLQYELQWLKAKLATRDPGRLKNMPDFPVPHPLFIIVPGEIEPWERVSATRSS